MILKFFIDIGYFLYHVRENQNPHAYHSLYLSLFSFSSFLSQISQLLREPESSKFVYTPTMVKYVM